MDGVEGSWVPLGVDVVAGLFAGAPFRWHLAGGQALELAVGRSWREHGDVDVDVSRGDTAALHAYLDDWELHVAARGELTRWRGDALREGRGENNVWVRRGPDQPWSLDVVVGDGDATHWWSRRDPSVRLPWSEASGHRDGVPFLAPHVQLLMKAKHPRPKDHLDAREVIPSLDERQATRLAAWLGRRHPWQRLLDER